MTRKEGRLERLDGSGVWDRPGFRDPGLESSLESLPAVEGGP